MNRIFSQHILGMLLARDTFPIFRGRSQSLMYQLQAKTPTKAYNDKFTPVTFLRQEYE